MFTAEYFTNVQINCKCFRLWNAELASLSSTLLRFRISDYELQPVEATKNLKQRTLQFFHRKPRHQVTCQRFCSLVKIYMELFQSIVTSSGAWVVHNLIQTVVT